MPNVTSNASYQQILSMAIEDRSSGYEDLVSNNNALLAVMRRKGLWQTYSGPKIRQTLQIGKQSAQWYSGYDQLMNVYESYISAAEKALEDAMDAGIYSDGTANGNKQITGLATAFPVANTTGVYGGIDRGSAIIWRTATFDANSFLAGATQVSSTTIRPMLNYIMTQRSRGRDYADLLLMSPEHYAAYDAATVAIQRQQNETSLGKLGFSALEYIGGGKRAEIVLDGGIGSNMPANTTFGLNTDSFRLRYHPNRNFDNLFDGEGQMPIDKDAIAQFIGWMGELTQVNPLFNWRVYDSNPAT